MTMQHMRVGTVLVASSTWLLLHSIVQAEDRPAAGANPVAKQSAPATQRAVGPAMTVYKNATCGCCGNWVQHMKQHGFDLTVHDVDNMSPVKERVGLPYGLGSCHTAEIGGYFIEGHVPAAEVARLLQEKPQAKGLAVPGMPVGSPGMEQGDRQQPYDVLLVKHDGTTSVFAHYPK